MAAPSDGASSISVAVRVRPFTIREAAQLTKTDDSPLFLGEGSLAGAAPPKLSQKGLRSIIKVVDDKCLVFDPPEDNPVQRFSKSVVPQGKRTKDQTFAFDKVFDENTNQADVYEATTKSLLDNVLDGYNATVFAYGATGCGKTHTITGTVQNPGIIFLTMQELFERIQDLHEDKVTEISLSYLEIYNETIRDLLVPGGTKGGLMLREDANQAVSVAGLSSHHPQNVQEVMDLIVRGNEYRTMSPTEANATSSRSHAVLQINVAQRDRNANISEPHTLATLSIIDLAGSERASATKNRGDRLTEGANINKSLLALGSCINALCDPRRNNHVPYRNSKLTRLLKFSLGGNCKTVMIVCVSPSSAHFDETQNTLRYANRAKNIQTKVTRNVFNVNRHVKDFLKKIDEQITLINELKAQQKDYEQIAFAKFRKQSEKRDAIVREGIVRLRNAYDHSSSERTDRVNSAKKLRQIERRISILNGWLSAFEFVCESREWEEQPPQNMTNLRKTAQGILVELEQSRSHYQSRLSKTNWHRTINTALDTGLKQLQESDGVYDNSANESLQREAELLKASADREVNSAVLEQEKANEGAVLQLLLRAQFETASLINRLLQMGEQQAMEAGREYLSRILNTCSEAVHHVIKPESSAAVVEIFPPTKSGTPKRTKLNSLAPSPAVAAAGAVRSSLSAHSLPVPVVERTRLSMSPFKSSPRRRPKLGSARKNVSFTPKKKSPAKRGVRWRDDTEDGLLAEWSQTPQQPDSTPPQAQENDATDTVPAVPLPSTHTTESEDLSSPVPVLPQINFENKPKPGSRFQAGFLSRKMNGSPHSSALPTFSSSPEPSPLQEVNANKASGRLSSDLMPPPSKEGYQRDQENTPQQHRKDQQTSSTSTSDSDEAKELCQALKRASLSRRQSSLRDSMNRVHRRRSPSSTSAATNNGIFNDRASSPPSDGGLFTASHARRMVRNEREVSGNARHSVLSPKATPISKHDGSSSRRATLSGDSGLFRSASHREGSAGSRLSATPIGAGNRSSMMNKGKAVWR